MNLKFLMPALSTRIQADYKISDSFTMCFDFLKEKTLLLHKNDSIDFHLDKANLSLIKNILKSYSGKEIFRMNLYVEGKKYECQLYFSEKDENDFLMVEL